MTELKVYSIAKEREKRTCDVVVYGATGFTGKEVAKYLCRNARADLKWAIAGRSQSKLGQLKSHLMSTIANGSLPDIFVSDAEDTRTLQAMFAETRLVLNCTGPFRFLGRQVVEACLVVQADYMDICGEPQFMETCFLDYHALACEKKVLIVHACAFDSVPADLGCLFAQQQYPKDCCAHIESFLHIKCPKGLKAHYTTFECAVHGVGDAASLKEIRKKIDAKYKPGRLEHVGPKLQRNTGSYFDKRVDKYAIPFMGADASVVRQSQRALSLNTGASVFPQYAAYACLNSFYWVATAGFYGTIFQTLSSFEMGRSLLLSCPEMLSAGVFSHDGPSKAQLEQTSFEMHFYSLGYSQPLPAESDASASASAPATTTTTTTKGGREILSPDQLQGTSTLNKGCEFPSFASSSSSSSAAGGTDRARKDKPDRKMHTVVTGPEPGYVATPAIFVTLALSMLEQRSSLPSGGVATPAAVWAGVPEVFDRLRASGIGFRVVGANWDEGIRKSRVLSEVGADEPESDGGGGGGGNASGEQRTEKGGERGHDSGVGVPLASGKEGLSPSNEADSAPVRAQLLSPSSADDSWEGEKK